MVVVSYFGSLSQKNHSLKVKRNVSVTDNTLMEVLAKEIWLWNVHKAIKWPDVDVCCLFETLNLWTLKSTTAGWTY